ncbi:MAG: hypothetical protein WDW38_007692 [Sanguina aurantia]
MGTDADPLRKIDLRSDTVTKPTPEMRAAMFAAEVGDDVWGDDPSINRLQRMAADMFGMEDSLFCPSGTMTNQIAIKIHTRPGDELLCSDTAHIYWYEGGGIAANSGVQAKLLKCDRGRFSAQQVSDAINEDNVHYPATRLVCVENTGNKAGGSIYSGKQMQEVSALCRSRGIAIHLDGARIFNAIVEADYTPKDLGQWFDTISVCLSKGLGCPVGSLLLGSTANIDKARRVRKMMGGGMRQAGFLAAAGIYALEHNIERLREDHAKARKLGETLLQCSFCEGVLPVETNIAIALVKSEFKASDVVVKLLAAGVMCGCMGHCGVRFVTHLDVSDADIERTCTILKEMVL